tara:strand:+ start:59 stop:373 length:315 start_codon:yes stop_codon:yes gene_type:complete
MIVVSMFFPNTNQTKFDNIYYRDSHYKIVRNLLDPLGLVEIEMLAGVSDTSPETPPKYHAITNFKFKSIENVHNAFTQTAKTIIIDSQNFTNTKPLFQISEIIV